MAKIETLKHFAEMTGRHFGHKEISWDFGTWVTPSEHTVSYGKAGVCKYCQAPVIIETKPAPGHGMIRGEAVRTKCKGRS